MFENWGEWRPPTMKTAVYGGLVGVISITVFRYRRAIQREMQKVQDESLIFGGLTMVRQKPSVDNVSTRSLGRTMVLELNPDFVELHNEKWRFTSLGDYLSSLRPGVIPGNIETKDLPGWIQTELEAGLATSLVKLLGPTAGRALLPALGMGPVPSVVSTVASNLVSRFWSKSSKEGGEDQGLLSLTLYNALGFSDMNATRVSNKKKRDPESTTNEDLTAMDKMKIGEYGPTPSYGSSFLAKDEESSEQEKPLIPNPFVVSEHWEPAIRGMEELISSSASYQGAATRMEVDARNDIDPSKEENVVEVIKYDPNGKELIEPVPVDEKIFPDLHLGFGGAKCTHTHREIVQNRLIAVLLNRLAANYHDFYTDGETEEKFILQMDKAGKQISRPHEFFDALIESGHDVTMQVATQPTTFGVALCIKEEDGSWTNVPLSYFFGSGYETDSGQKVPALLPHSGVNLELTGPLIGSSSRCSLQHYMAIEGMCGWHSNHDADVPWLQRTYCGPSLKGVDVSRAARVAALYGVLLNTVGTEMDLPFGGYGLTAVCNDTAAVLEHSLHGSTNIYPLTSIGRFSMHVIRYAKQVRDNMSNDESMAAEVKDLNSLMRSIRSIPSDLAPSPRNVEDAGKRMLHCLPDDLPFELMLQTEKNMGVIMEEYEHFG